jgi:hypothetical protein
VRLLKALLVLRNGDGVGKYLAGREGRERDRQDERAG